MESFVDACWQYVQASKQASPSKQAQAAHLTTGASKQGSKPKQANETQPYRQAETNQEISKNM